MEHSGDASDPSLSGRQRWWNLAKAHKIRAGLAAAAVALIVIVAVPPFRQLATLATSKVILVVFSPFAPSTKGLDTAPQASKVVAADGSLLGTFDVGDRTSVHVADLPPQVKQAVLAAEDADFYHHSGINPSSIVRAALNMATGSATQGGSTITQQVAKLNYTTGERTIFRKLREVLYASRLEKDYTKDQILERYLNQVYFGDGSYGIESAALRTFGVHAAQLTPEQAATIAVRIRSPRGLDPRKTPVAPVLDRRNRVLANMAAHGWLTKDELAAAQAAPLAPIPLPPAAAKVDPQVLDRARSETAGLGVLGPTADDRLAKLEGGGLTIETALDPKTQKAAHDAASKLLPRPEDPSAAIVSVTPGHGAITVLVGDSKGGQFDVATRGRRQPGSSFKPFTYLAALEAGISPQTTFSSASPVTLQFEGQPFTVKNAEPGTGQPTTIDDGMVESVNAVYSQLVLRVGPAKVVKVAQRFGEPTDLQANPSIALGGLRDGVSPLQQAAAYATFASGGTYATPYLVTRIRDAQGKVIWQHDEQTRRAMQSEEAGVLDAVLQRVVAEGTGRAAAIGRPVLGKTGTTNESVDAWFIGATPQLATAVWVGHPEGATPITDARGRPMFGGGAPAQVFSATMKVAMTGLPPLPLPTATPAQLGLAPPGGATTTSTATTAPTTTLAEATTTTVPVGEIVTLPTVPFVTATTKPKVRPTCPTTTTPTPGVSTTTQPPGATTTSTTLPPGC